MNRCRHSLLRMQGLKVPPPTTVVSEVVFGPTTVGSCVPQIGFHSLPLREKGVLTSILFPQDTGLTTAHSIHTAITGSYCDTCGVAFQCISFLWRPKSHSEAHLYITCTHRHVQADTHIHSIISSWVATRGFVRNRLPHPHPHPPDPVDLQTTFVRIWSFFSWPKSWPRSCQVYFWHSQIIARLLTSPQVSWAIIGLCQYALWFRLAERKGLIWSKKCFHYISLPLFHSACVAKSITSDCFLIILWKVCVCYCPWKKEVFLLPLVKRLLFMGTFTLFSVLKCCMLWFDATQIKWYWIEIKWRQQRQKWAILIKFSVLMMRQSGLLSLYLI